MRNTLIVSLIFMMCNVSYAGSDPCAGGGSGDQLACAESKLKIAENAMNLAFQEALVRVGKLDENESIKGEIHANLKLSQQKWVSYRNVQCELEGSVTLSAANWPAVHSVRCKVELTNQRVEYLKSVMAEK